MPFDRSGIHPLLVSPSLGERETACGCGVAEVIGSKKHAPGKYHAKTLDYEDGCDPLCQQSFSLGVGLAARNRWRL
jgi:hypothetical protein